MEKYDVIVAGGGISGSRAAAIAADCGLRTLLLEQFKTPRNKACSGIQFAYFEKLIGSKIPPEKLCRNKLSKIEMILPSGKVLKAKMKMLNFERQTFDSWLNSEAVKAGAEFRDETALADFYDEEGVIAVRLQMKGVQKR